MLAQASGSTLLSLNDPSTLPENSCEECLKLGRSTCKGKDKRRAEKNKALRSPIINLVAKQREKAAKLLIELGTHPRES